MDVLDEILFSVVCVCNCVCFLAVLQEIAYSCHQINDRHLSVTVIKTKTKMRTITKTRTETITITKIEIENEN